MINNGGAQVHNFYPSVSSGTTGEGHLLKTVATVIIPTATPR